MYERFAAGTNPTTVFRFSSTVSTTPPFTDLKFPHSTSVPSTRIALVTNPPLKGWACRWTPVLA